MDIEIKTSLHLDLYGFSDSVVNKEYTATAFKLMDKMWHTVKQNSLKNKGMNIWVYEPSEKIFAGVVLIDPPQQNIALEHKKISLKKYAYYKHIGSYSLIKQVGQNMTNELKKKGHVSILPYIEVYGHWTNDESKLETELLMSLE